MVFQSINNDFVKDDVEREGESRHSCVTPTVLLNHYFTCHTVFIVYCASDFAVKALYDVNQVGIEVLVWARWLNAILYQTL